MATPPKKPKDASSTVRKIQSLSKKKAGNKVSLTAYIADVKSGLRNKDETERTEVALVDESGAVCLYLFADDACLITEAHKGKVLQLKGVRVDEKGGIILKSDGDCDVVLSPKTQKAAALLVHFSDNPPKLAEIRNLSNAAVLKPANFVREPQTIAALKRYVSERGQRSENINARWVSGRLAAAKTPRTGLAWGGRCRTVGCRTGRLSRKRRFGKKSEGRPEEWLYCRGCGDEMPAAEAECIRVSLTLEDEEAGSEQQAIMAFGGELLARELFGAKGIAQAVAMSKAQRDKAIQARIGKFILCTKVSVSHRNGRWSCKDAEIRQ